MRYRLPSTPPPTTALKSLRPNATEACSGGELLSYIPRNEARLPALSLPSIPPPSVSCNSGDLGFSALTSSSFKVRIEVNRSRSEFSKFTFVVADLASQHSHRAGVAVISLGAAPADSRKPGYQAH